MANQAIRGSQYCNAKLVEAGPIRVTIKEILLDQEIGREKELRDVVVFENFGPRLVLRTTIRNWFIENPDFGPEDTNWVGKEVELYQSETSFGPHTKKCLRVRSPID